MLKEKEKGRPKCNICYQTDGSEQVMHVPFSPAALMLVIKAARYAETLEQKLRFMCTTVDGGERAQG